MNVIDDSLYIPTDIESVSESENLDDGKVNAVELLYNENDIEYYPTYEDVDFSYQDYYNISVQQNFTMFVNRPT